MNKKKFFVRPDATLIKNQDLREHVKSWQKWAVKALTESEKGVILI